MGCLALIAPFHPLILSSGRRDEIEHVVEERDEHVFVLFGPEDPLEREVRLEIGEGGSSHGKAGNGRRHPEDTSSPAARDGFPPSSCRLCAQRSVDIAITALIACSS